MAEPREYAGWAQIEGIRGDQGRFDGKMARSLQPAHGSGRSLARRRGRGLDLALLLVLAGLLGVQAVGIAFPDLAPSLASIGMSPGSLLWASVVAALAGFAAER
jgi:hypothetical protein